MNAWLHVTASGDDTFDDDERADGVGSDLSHFYELFFGFVAWNDAKVVGSLELWRDTELSSIGTLLVLVSPRMTLGDSSLVSLYRIKSSLLHDNIKG